jgi:hypothetical protein
MTIAIFDTIIQYALKEIPTIRYHLSQHQEDHACLPAGRGFNLRWIGPLVWDVRPKRRLEWGNRLARGAPFFS